MIDKTIAQAIEVLKTEAESILKLTERIDENFTRAVDIIFQSRGRLIIAGIGKSGLIGRKIAATLNSTGTRAIFLHPVEAMHGDLGILSDNDVFLAISNSGETDELNILLPSIRSIGCPIIAFTGHPMSTLAQQSDLVINVNVEKEACPMGLAPTSSTTAQLAMGDALAVVLINRRQFKSSDFQKFHPGGQLGRRLSFKAKDIMFTDDAIPMVSVGTIMDQALDIMNEKRLGVIFITGENRKIKGIITDGDIRRLVVGRAVIHDQPVETLMTKNPRTLLPETPLYEALNIMETHQITVMPVVETNGELVGTVHLHDILGKGAVKFNGV